MRHEWLATPLKKKRVKRCQKARIGLLEAEQRKAAKKGRTAKKRTSSRAKSSRKKSSRKKTARKSTRKTRKK